MDTPRLWEDRPLPTYVFFARFFFSVRVTLVYSHRLATNEMSDSRTFRRENLDANYIKTVANFFFDANRSVESITFASGVSFVRRLEFIFTSFG